MTQDIFDYLTSLGQERYRAVILHAEPNLGPQVSRFVQKVCASVDGKYFDLLDFFINNPDLSARIDSFGPVKLRDLLVEHARGTSLLVVDQADFLLDTWRRRERQDFFRMINNQWDGYKNDMRAKLIFALQTSLEIESLQIADSQLNPRVLRLSDFNDIL